VIGIQANCELNCNFISPQIKNTQLITIATCKENFVTQKWRKALAHKGVADIVYIIVTQLGETLCVYPYIYYTTHVTILLQDLVIQMHSIGGRLQKERDD